MIYKTFENGKRTRAYSVWYNMHERVSKSPSYRGCTISEPWYDFQCFAVWYYAQKGHGDLTYQLDKDILVRGNKLYSEDTCVLVPQQVNKLLNEYTKGRGDLPIGVTLNKGKYTAQLRVNGRRIHLVSTNDPYVAFMAYKQAKENHIKYLMTETEYSELDPRVVKALLDYRVVMEE